ncbi:MAG: hypothetical protein CMH52_09285 [Myxococcales bacterium]|nr:hypothetical protein [Myxococcales bacterium]
MRISYYLSIISLLCACSGRQHIAQPQNQQAINQGDVRQDNLLKKAENAALAGRIKRAEKYLRKAQLKPMSRSHKLRAAYVRALIVGQTDAGRGVDALTKVIRQTKDKGLARSASTIAFRWAIVSKRCLTARRIKKKLGTLRPSDRRRFTVCQDTSRAFIVLAELMANDPQNKGTRKHLRARLRTTKIDDLYASLEIDSLVSIHGAIAVEAASRKDGNRSTNMTRLLVQRLPKNHAYQEALIQELHRPQLKLILPLSGPGHLTGRRVKLAIENLYPATGTGGSFVAPKLAFVDGGTKDLVETAFNMSPENGSFFATIALLDSAAAAQMTELARTQDHPIIMITKSDKPIRSGGPVWRALHTPILVARTLAGAAIERNVNDILVLRRKDDRYGSVHSYWLGKVWQATQRGRIQDVVFDSKASSFGQLFNTLSKYSFDAIYLPMDATQAVEVMQYLAAHKIWAKGPKKRFAPSEAMREVYIFGTPEWYSSRAIRRARRYGENAIFPAFYAAETQEGSILNATLTTKTGQPATLIQALVSDLILALNRANSTSVTKKMNAVDAIRATRFQSGSTAGIDFSRPDAVPQLFLMQLRRDGPALLSIAEDDPQ